MANNNQVLSQAFEIDGVKEEIQHRTELPQQVFEFICVKEELWDEERALPEVAEDGLEVQEFIKKEEEYIPQTTTLESNIEKDDNCEEYILGLEPSDEWANVVFEKPSHSAWLQDRPSEISSTQRTDHSDAARQQHSQVTGVSEHPECGGHEERTGTSKMLSAHMPSTNRGCDSITKNVQENPAKHTLCHICEICGKGFKFPGQLSQHVRVHTGERPYTCGVCGKRFTNSSVLKQHERIHNNERPFKCKTCGKCFRQSGILSRHTRIHTGEKPYSCEICGKGFTQFGHLQTHTLTHSTELPFKCNTCGKNFAYSKTLLRHSRLHVVGKPYVCNTCGKSFSNDFNLQRHKHIHSGEFPFRCNVCGKCFRHSGTLVRHNRIHSGEKPFFCNVCDKRFTFLTSLKKHKCIPTS